MKDNKMFNLKDLISTGKTNVPLPVAIIVGLASVALIFAFVWLNLLSIASAINYATGITISTATALFLFFTFKVKWKGRNYQVLPEFIRHKLFVVLNIGGLAWACFYSDWPAYQILFLGVALILIYNQEVSDSKKEPQ